MSNWGDKNKLGQERLTASSLNGVNGAAKSVLRTEFFGAADSWNLDPSSPLLTSRRGAALVLAAAAVFAPPITADIAAPATDQPPSVVTSPTLFRRAAPSLSSIVGPIAADAAVTPSDPPDVVASPSLSRRSTVYSFVASPPLPEGPSGNDILRPVASPWPLRAQLAPRSAIAAPWALDYPSGNDIAARGVSSPPPQRARPAPTSAVSAPWLVDGPSGTDLLAPVASPALSRARMPASSAVGPVEADAAVADAQLIAPAASPVLIRARTLAGWAVAPPDESSDDPDHFLVVASPAYARPGRRSWPTTCVTSLSFAHSLSGTIAGTWTFAGSLTAAPYPATPSTYLRNGTRPRIWMKRRHRRT